MILESNTWFWDTILPRVVLCKGYSGRRWDTFCCSVLDEPKGDKGAKADGLHGGRGAMRQWRILFFVEKRDVGDGVFGLMFRGLNKCLI